MMGGITPLFNVSSVASHINRFVAHQMNLSYDAFVYLGEEFVNKARNSRTYKDKSGNLRGSIGYIIVRGTETLKQNIDNSTEEGAEEALKEALKKLEELGIGSNDMVLIGVAGMEYAVFVETKGYDVITNSAPTEQLMRETLEDFSNGNR